MMKVKKWIIILLMGFLVSSGWFGYQFYHRFYEVNINLDNTNYELLIASESNYNDVMQKLEKSGIVKDINSLKWLAEQMNYPNHVSSGRYIIKPNLSNRQLILLLRSATQTPVKITLNKFRTKESLASFISSKIEADSTSIMNMLNDPVFLAEHGFTVDNVMCVFVHNTYEFYWNTNAEMFFERMLKEYKKYWNETRLAKAQKLNLTPEEVITLASIVEEETNNKSEKPIIAAVYLNRLRKNMKLQADPTIRFALNNFKIKRIRFSHLSVNSRYNTYTNEGLPPGPICTPTPVSIESVLKNMQHNYYFFCAKEDFSGTHNFAATHAEHLIFAQRYHDSLDVKLNAIDTTSIL